jgi:hypothetical protein
METLGCWREERSSECTLHRRAVTPQVKSDNVLSVGLRAKDTGKPHRQSHTL